MKNGQRVFEVEALESRKLLSTGPKLHGSISGMLTVSADRQTITIDSAQLTRLSPVGHFSLESQSTIEFAVFYRSQPKTGDLGDGVVAADAYFTLDPPKSQPSYVFIDLKAPSVKIAFTRSTIRFNYKADRDVYDSVGMYKEFSMGTGTATLTAPSAFAHPGTSRPFTLVFKPSHH